jgi:hypothetical protein
VRPAKLRLDRALLYDTRRAKAVLQHLLSSASNDDRDTGPARLECGAKGHEAELAATEFRMMTAAIGKAMLSVPATIITNDTKAESTGASARTSGPNISRTSSPRRAFASRPKGPAGCLLLPRTNAPRHLRDSSTE